MLNESKIWYAASIHKSDGHKINGYFVTESMEVLSNFGKTLKPLETVFTRFKDQNEAREFFKDFPPSFIEICPLTYPINSTYSRLSCIHKTEIK